MLEITLGSPFAIIDSPLSWWGLTMASLMLLLRVDTIVAFLSGHLLALTRLILQILASVVLAAVFGPVWWQKWVTDEWPGPPKWLSEFYEGFISGPEWTIQTEMVITLSVGLSLIVFVFNVAEVVNSFKTEDPDPLDDFVSWSKTDRENTRLGDETARFIR